MKFKNGEEVIVQLAQSGSWPEKARIRLVTETWAAVEMLSMTSDRWYHIGTALPDDDRDPKTEWHTWRPGLNKGEWEIGYSVKSIDDVHPGWTEGIDALLEALDVQGLIAEQARLEAFREYNTVQ